MALTKEKKTKIVNEFKRDEHDTGSVEVQVAILTNEINALTIHLKVPKSVLVFKNLSVSPTIPAKMYEAVSLFSLNLYVNIKFATIILAAQTSLFI